MKFVLSYTLRAGGSIEERVTAGEAAQKLLANWAPSDTATIRDLAVWAPWLDFEVVPVLDIADATPIQQDALQKARSVL
jgi:hypothetical protein